MIFPALLLALWSSPLIAAWSECRLWWRARAERLRRAGEDAALRRVRARWLAISRNL